MGGMATARTRQNVTLGDARSLIIISSESLAADHEPSAICSGLPGAVTRRIVSGWVRNPEKRFDLRQLRPRFSGASQGGPEGSRPSRLHCLEPANAEGPAQPSPTLGDALNAGYLYLEVRCLGCDTNQTVALGIVRDQRRHRSTKWNGTCAARAVRRSRATRSNAATSWRCGRPKFPPATRRQYGGPASDELNLRSVSNMGYRDRSPQEYSAPRLTPATARALLAQCCISVGTEYASLTQTQTAPLLEETDRRGYRFSLNAPSSAGASVAFVALQAGVGCWR
jgi:hypothetical protein